MLRTSVGQVTLASGFSNLSQARDLKNKIDRFISNPDEAPLTYQRDTLKVGVVMIFVSGLLVSLGLAIGLYNIFTAKT